jgi:hypothetical protein
MSGYPVTGAVRDHGELEYCRDRFQSETFVHSDEPALLEVNAPYGAILSVYNGLASLDFTPPADFIQAVTPLLAPGGVIIMGPWKTTARCPRTVFETVTSTVTGDIAGDRNSACAYVVRGSRDFNTLELDIDYFLAEPDGVETGKFFTKYDLVDPSEVSAIMSENGLEPLHLRNAFGDGRRELILGTKPKS